MIFCNICSRADVIRGTPQTRVLFIYVGNIHPPLLGRDSMRLGVNLLAHKINSKIFKNAELYFFYVWRNIILNKSLFLAHLGLLNVSANKELITDLIKKLRYISICAFYIITSFLNIQNVNFFQLNGYYCDLYHYSVFIIQYY